MAASLRDLRIADPEAARLQALDILRTVYHHDVDPGVESRFEALLALAAVYRVRGSNGTAAAYLLKALHTAGGCGRRRARLLNAIIPFSVGLGDFEIGLQAAALALSEFARLEDFQGQGRVLVSKGILLWHAGQLNEAVDAYSKSLLVLPEDLWCQHFSALHGLGLCYLLKGELSKALEYVDRSVAALDSGRVSALQEAAARFLRGDILLKMGSSEGIPELRAALDLRSKENANKLDLALISLRLACAYHDHGRFEELGKLTTSLVPLLGKLTASNRLMQGGLAELHSRLVRGELSRGVLQRTYQALVNAGRKATAGQLPVD